MSYYTKNIKYLSQFMSKDSLKELHKGALEHNFKIGFDHENENILIKKGNSEIYLNSLYNIENEMNEMYNCIEKNGEIIVLFGVGYGHSLNYIIDKLKDVSHLIIIEPSEEIFQNILDVVDFTMLMKTVNSVSFIIGNDIKPNLEKFESILLLKDSVFCNLVWSINYRTLFSEYFDEISNVIKRLLKNITIGINVVRSRVVKWNYNILMNITNESILFEDIKENFKDKTIVLISAGPSLNKNVQLLKEIKDKAITVAVGTSIRVLDKLRIEPDFYLAIEGSDDEYKIFEDLNNKEVPLIYTNSFNARAFKEYTGKKIEIVLDNDGLTKYIYKESGIKYESNRSSFACSTIALGLFLEAGCKKTIFIGQDLAYTGKQTYASGAPDEKAFFKDREDLFLTTDIYGNEIYSNRFFEGMSKDTAFLKSKYPNTEILNCTEGGMATEDVENKLFKDVIIELAVNHEKKENVKILKSRKNVTNIIESIKLIELEIENIEKFCDKAKKILTNINLDKKDIVQYQEDIIKVNIVKKDYEELYINKFFVEVIRKNLNTIFVAYENRFSKRNVPDNICELIKFLERVITLILEYSYKVKENIGMKNQD